MIGLKSNWISGPHCTKCISWQAAFIYDKCFKNKQNCCSWFDKFIYSAFYYYKCTKHKFLHLLMATFKNFHIKNSKNYKRWYCSHHTDCVSMYCWMFVGCSWFCVEGIHAEVVHTATLQDRITTSSQCARDACWKELGISKACFIHVLRHWILTFCSFIFVNTYTIIVLYFYY